MKLKLGMVGYGAIAEKFQEPGIRSSRLVELAGIYDKNFERIRKFDSAGSGTRCYGTYEEMLSDKSIDAISVATPNKLHCPQVVAAARAGKHVICEKPIALSVEEARLMVEECSKAGVTFMVAHHLRYKECNIRALEAVKKGVLGRVASARARWSFSIPDGKLEDGWRENREISGGGQIMNVNSHCIDLLVYIFGRPLKVSAFIQAGQDSGVEDGSYVMMEFPGGILATSQGSYREQGVANILDISGSGLSLQVEGACSSDGRGRLIYLPSGKTEECDMKESPYCAEFEHFARCVMEKSEPVSSGRRILDTMAVLEAAYASAATGKHINL